VKLYVSFYSWQQKPSQCPEGLSEEEFSKLPLVIGPMIDCIEINEVPILHSLDSLREQIALRTGSIRVVIISVIQLPLGSDIIVPSAGIITPRGNMQ